jgi:hypothetical protein
MRSTALCTFVHAVLYGGTFGLFTSIFAPQLIAGGLLVTVSPEVYEDGYVPDDSPTGKAVIIALVLIVLAVAFNLSVYWHGAWFLT